MISYPVAVEPVKATFETPLCLAIADPTSPKPGKI